MKILKKCVLSFLVVCILVSTCACKTLSQAVDLPNGPHISERAYEKIDEEAAYALIDEIKTLCLSEDNLEAVIEKREQFFIEYYNKIFTYSTIAQINYDKNVNDEYWQEESVWIQNFSQRLHNETLELEKAILQSPCADHFIEELGQDYADSILNVQTATDEQLELLDTIAELEAQYMPLYSDQESTEDDFAELLKELVVARNEYARTVKDDDGEYYENYLDYAYENVYGRDYTPDDSIVYRDAMKQYVSPLVNTVYEYYKNYYLPNLASVSITADQIKSFLPEIIWSTVPEMIVSWDYMMERELYDFDYSSTKANTSYVIHFEEYSDAYMFLNASKSFMNDLSTTIHEFGHYNAAIMSKSELKDEKAGRSTDLAETHSQAFELLTLPAVKKICDKYYPTKRGLYQMYSVNLIFNSLWSMLSGCVIDAFEYEIYTADEDELTTEFLKQRFNKNLSYYFPLSSSYEFYDIAHIFIYPCYYISYSVSMVNSYVVWASDDPIQNYVKVVEYGTNNYLSTVCEKTNLDNPFVAETIENIARAIKDYTYETFA